MAAPRVADAVAALGRDLRRHHEATADHSHRLAELAREVADRLRLRPEALHEVELVAVLHDVGKLAIEPELLDWPGPLTDAQIARMRRHTIEGEELLTARAGLEHLAGAVRATHEAWDGSGYPDGLRGEQIPVTARIVAVVDAFDAMVTDRAYRRALPRREALRRLRSAAGIQFDPGVVDAMLAVLARTTRVTAS